MRRPARTTRAERESESEGSRAAYRLGADVRALRGLREQVLTSLEQRGHVPIRDVVGVPALRIPLRRRSRLGRPEDDASRRLRRDGRRARSRVRAAGRALGGRRLRRSLAPEETFEHGASRRSRRVCPRVEAPRLRLTTRGPNWKVPTDSATWPGSPKSSTPPGHSARARALSSPSSPSRCGIRVSPRST